MAVNFIKLRHSMIFHLPSLWKVYTQILRHNSEKNKGSIIILHYESRSKNKS